jgi:hypothetical protein
MEPEFLQWPLENNSAALAFACDPEQWCEGQAGKARRTSYRHASGVPAPEALLPYCWDSLDMPLESLHQRPYFLTAGIP